MNSRLACLKFWTQKFENAAIDSPRLSAQIIFAHILKISRIELLLNLNVSVSAADLSALKLLCERRMAGEPVAYIVNSREFYGLDFFVDHRVLIPRPETELIIDYLVRNFAGNSNLRLLDIGTGSGAIAITCACQFPHSKIVAIDLSLDALRVAKINVSNHQVSNILLVNSDLSECINFCNFDVIVANLPYVPLKHIDSISREVVNYEPGIALFSGEDGLDLYRRLAFSLCGAVSKGVVLICEIDYSQANSMRLIFGKWSKNVQIVRDYSGLDRVVIVVF